MSIALPVPAHGFLDTHAQRTVHRPLRRYPAIVDTSQHLAAARRAIGSIAALEAKVETAREERDAAIVRMHKDDGLNAPAIARALNMSVSSIRLVLKVDAKTTAKAATPPAS